MKKQQINADFITQTLYYYSPGASQKPMQPKAHTIPHMLNGGMKNKPQINADERRLIALKHRKKRKAEQEDINSYNKKSGNNINNELVRTETNSRHSEFVRVSFSSLLIDCQGIPAAPEAS
ncbi:Uncharacterised protein [uncultured archaeon]|nr:Uncharacterised protein [uncultured archaeon]